MREWTDDIILTKLRSGKEREIDDAMRWLFDEYFGLILHFIQKNNGTAEDAEDLFQDGLLVLYKQVIDEELVLTCTIKTYLYSICRYQWSNHLRKKKEVELNEDENEYITIQHSQLESLIESEEGKLIAELFEKLGEDCKRILIYFYYDQLRMKTIAEKMNLSSEQIAKNKKSKCLKGLRQLVLNSPFYKNILR